MSNIRRILCGLGAAAMLAAPALAADPTDAMISTASALTEEYDLPAGLILAVAEVESGFDPECRTGKCHGLMQIHSSYAAEYAKVAGMTDYDLFDPDDSMRIGASMLDGYIDKYDSLSYALMCYNLGEAGARRNGGSSTWYSRKVEGKMDKWAAVQAEHASSTEQEANEPAKVEEATVKVEEAIASDSTRAIISGAGMHSIINSVHLWAKEVLFR